MKPRFSDRIGVTEEPPLQINSVSISLRHSLWNLLLLDLYGGKGERYLTVSRFLYLYFFRKPIDELPRSLEARDVIKRCYYSLSWYDVFNLVEFVTNSPNILLISEGEFIDKLNVILEKENAGYRYFNGGLQPITDPVEIESIANAIEDARKHRLYGATEHIAQASRLLSKKPDPDYRNSIKESISAVETVAKIIGSEGGNGLDKALDILNEKIHFHGGFRKGLLSLYGYTSDEDGIRHAILDEKEIGFDEAKYMLVACSAFVNFLIAKGVQNGLLPG